MSHSTADQQRDIITSLPDEIRSLIVSLLPIKDAVRTKILSKKWKNVFSSIPTLMLDQFDFERNNNSHAREFSNFVDHTLSSRDGSTLQTFTLVISSKDDEYVINDRINAWVSFAVQHNVEVFSFMSASESPTLETIPCCLFTCTTLTSLSLESIRGIQRPETISFPNLKSLNLYFLEFRDESVTLNLFSSNVCPVLEELVIHDCSFYTYDTISISISTLKFLRFVLYDEDIHVNLLVLRENLSSLHVQLEFMVPDSPEDEFPFHDSARKILMGLHHVHKLSLSTGLIENVARDKDFSMDWPKYWSMEVLNANFAPTPNQIQVVLFLLRTSPRLQTVHLVVEEEYLGFPSPKLNNMEKDRESNEFYDGVVLNNLTTVIFEEFGGSVDELYIVRYLLAMAPILEKLEIFCSNELKENAEKRRVTREKLSSFTNSAIISLSLIKRSHICI